MSDRKGANLSRLDSFQLGVRRAGGADIMSHISSMLQHNSTVNVKGVHKKLVEIQADLEGFFYNINPMSYFKALIKVGDLPMLRAAWSLLGRGGGSVSCITASGFIHVLNAPNTGLPVGHPFSAYLACLAVAQAFNNSFVDCKNVNTHIDIPALKAQMVIINATLMILNFMVL